MSVCFQSSMRLRQTEHALSQSHLPGCLIRRNRYALSLRHRSRYLVQRMILHQTVLASMTSQNFHHSFVRFHQTVFAWMRSQSFHHLCVRFHQTVLAWMMSRSCHRRCGRRHQRMTGPRHCRRIHGYRMLIQMSCFRFDGQHCCSYTMACCSNRHARSGCFGSTLSSCSSRNKGVHRY